MKSRLFLVVGLTGLLLAAWSGSAKADPIYTFTNTSGGPVSRADFAIVPAGSVQAPIVIDPATGQPEIDPATGLPKTASPVTIDTTQSSGFDFNNFSTALGTGTNVQGLRLLFGQKQIVQNGTVTFQPVFGPNGEAPRFLDNGGVVTFSLHLDPSFEGVVTLKSLTAGVPDATLVTNSIPTEPGNGNGGGGGAPEIPEPAGFVLWGVVLVGFVARKRWLPWQRAAVGA